MDISADRMDYDAIEDMTAVGDATCRSLLEQQLSPGSAQMQFDIVGVHAQQDLAAHG